MKQLKIGLALLFCFVAFQLNNCSGGGSQNRGVEVGNPSVSGKKLLISPDEGDSNFEVVLSSETGGVAIKIKKNDNTNRSLPEGFNFENDNGRVSFTVTFEDGTTINCVLIFNEDSEFQEGRLSINGNSTDAEFSEGVQFNEAASLASTQEGDQFLSNASIEDAFDSYCQALSDNPTNSQAAFGCFWTGLLFFVENDIEGLFINYTEPFFDTDTNLGSSFYSDLHILSAERLNSPPVILASLFPLPTSKLFPVEKIQLLGEEIENDGSQHSLVFESLEPIISLALLDPNFSFTLPADLYADIDEDITVTYNDARLFASSMKLGVILAKWLQAYKVGFTKQDVFTNNQLDKAKFVADLNGSGEQVNGVRFDNIPFLALKSSKAFRSSRNAFVEFLEIYSTALRTLAGGENSAFFRRTVDLNELNDMARFLEVLRDSAIRGLTVVDIFGGDAPTFQIDIRRFFENPVDPQNSNIEAGDPFTLLGADNELLIDTNENYIKALLDGILIF